MGRVTVLAERPTRPGNALVPSDPDHEQRPLSVVVGLAGLGALLVGIVPLVGLAVLSWLTSTWNGSGGSAPDAMRVGMHLWLAGHRVPVELAGRPMTVAPLGITLLVLAILFAAGTRIARYARILDWRDLAKAAGGLAAVYGAGLALTAVLARGAGSRANPWWALLAGAVLAAAAGGVGILAGSPALRAELRVRIPMSVRAGAVGAAVTVGVVALAGLVLTVVALVAHRERVSTLFGAYGGGWFSTLVLGLVCLALLPNAAVFGSAYLIGSGFAIGTGTIVSPMAVQLGAVPALPILGALPSPGVPPVSMTLSYAIAVLAGVLGIAAAIWYAARHGDDWRALPIDRAVIRGVATGLAAAVAVTGLILAAGGSWGDGRLARVGAPALTTLVLAVAWFGLTAAVGAALWWLTGRSTRVRA